MLMEESFWGSQEPHRHRAVQRKKRALSSLTSRCFRIQFQHKLGMEARIQGTEQCMSGRCRRGGSKPMQPCNEVHL